MKKMNIKTLAILTAAFLITANVSVYGGNEDRVGQAGAFELLVNPWSKSNGLSSSNIANARGIEGSYLNIAGMAFVQKTQVAFSHSQYLRGTDINVTSIGLAQRISDVSVIGLNILSMGFGEMPITTSNQPEGGIGNFAPSYLTIGLSYTRTFSHSIHGGFNVKIINESISDLTASGVAFDAGIQYVTGEYDNFRLGITLKNIGTPMSYSGDGIAWRGLINGSDNNLTMEMRSGEFEMPSLLALGASYSFVWGKTSNVSSMSTENEKAEELSYDNAHHVLTFSGAFIANSFSKDQLLIGVEYIYNQMFIIRGGYHYENGIIGNGDDRTTALVGPSAGAGFKLPLSKTTRTSVSIDYAYRLTNPWGGIHTIGALIDL